jgi:catechol 2,3-dioxygenase-like lactoylglutathione lyase family enzyme
VPIGRFDATPVITVVVNDYDPAISFFVGVLGFELVEDSPSGTDDRRPKRVVVRPPGAATGLLLARADGQDQAAAVGKQVAGLVGFFLQVENFDAAYQRMAAAGVRFLTHHVQSPTAESRYTATSLATDGTSSAPDKAPGQDPHPEGWEKTGSLPACLTAPAPPTGGITPSDGDCQGERAPRLRYARRAECDSDAPAHADADDRRSSRRSVMHVMPR